MSVSELLTQVALLAIAIGANALSALAGGGAGLVQLPALILLGLPFAMALATHKVASVALGLGATGRHWRASSLDLKRSALVLGAGLPGVWFGASVVLVLPDQVATTCLGLLTLGLGLYSARKPDLGTTDQCRPLSAQTVGVGVLGLFIIGVLNGSSPLGQACLSPSGWCAGLGSATHEPLPTLWSWWDWDGTAWVPWCWGSVEKSAGTGFLPW